MIVNIIGPLMGNVGGSWDQIITIVQTFGERNERGEIDFHNLVMVGCETEY